MTPPDGQLSVQTILMVGGVMGGAFATVNAALRLAERALSKRLNGNGSIRGDAKMIHEDIRVRPCNASPWK